MTVADFLILSRRSWRMLLIFLLVGIVGGALYGVLAPRTYESSSSGFVTVAGSNVFGGSTEATNRAQSYLPLITSRPVMDKIAENAKVSASAINGHLSAKIASGGTLIQVTATAHTPKAALTLANGALDALASVIHDVETQASANGQGQMTVIPMENAVAPTSPVSPNLKMALLIGAVSGLVLGYVVVFLRRALDTRVRSGNAFASQMRTGLLGRVPRLNGKALEHGLLARAGEPLRQIRAGLRFASVDRPVRSIVVTSPNPSEGKTTMSTSLAQVMAESGQRTVLVDADLRRPAVAKTLGIDGHVGLSEVLSGQVPLTDAVRATADTNLLVLPAGGIPPNPSEMLGSEAMRSLIAQLSRDAVVIIDCPPLLPVSDALLVGADSDGVILVAAAGKTRKTDVASAHEMLQQSHARLLGVVLNMVPPRDSSDGYSYYRQYHSYYAATEQTHAAAGATPLTPADSPTDEVAALLSEASSAPTRRRAAHSGDA